MYGRYKVMWEDFGLLAHNILPALIAFRFGLEESTRRTAVLFLKSKTSVNRWSGFLALGFQTFTEGLGNISVLDTISASRISLY